MSPWWSWALTAIGVFGLYLAGRRVWWAWFVGLGAQVPWVIYAVDTEQYGFVVSAFAYGWVYLKNGLAWRKDREIKPKRRNEFGRRAQILPDLQVPND
jgi:hypothetical protein